jgi:pyruvate kinase
MRRTKHAKILATLGPAPATNARASRRCSTPVPMSFASTFSHGKHEDRKGVALLTLTSRVGAAAPKGRYSTV